MHLACRTGVKRRNDETPRADAARRGFLLGLTAGVAGAAAGSLSIARSRPAVGAGSDAPAGSGYRLTPYIRRFYERANLR